MGASDALWFLRPVVLWKAQLQLWQPSLCLVFKLKPGWFPPAHRLLLSGLPSFLWRGDCCPCGGEAGGLIILGKVHFNLFS